MRMALPSLIASSTPEFFGDSPCLAGRRERIEPHRSAGRAIPSFVEPDVLVRAKQADNLELSGDSGGLSGPRTAPCGTVASLHGRNQPSPGFVDLVRNRWNRR